MKRRQMIGLFTTRIGRLRGPLRRPDLTVRREIDRAVYDLRLEIATACARKADECGEPPLDDDAA